MSSQQMLETLSQRVQAMQASKIREVAEIGMTMDGVIPLWFGEGAWPTPAKIVDAAVKSLQNDAHTYQPNNGLPALRQAVQDYCQTHLKAACSTHRITITPSGMQGLMLSAQLLANPGDRVVSIEPNWPNIVGCYETMGANVHSVALQAKNGVWQLDMNALIAALTNDTKIFIVNSPNNPSGWTLTVEEQKVLLQHCRKLGIWIVADDVYARLYRHASVAPSFLTIAEPEDRLISVNSFSKSWSMTGWRLGWLVTPPECEAALGHLTEFNTSCTSRFIQQAGITALQECEPEIAQLKSQLEQSYRVTADALSSMSQVEFIDPDGAFYAFFRVAGLNDSVASAMNILHATKVGLAPGAAFGKTGEGYLRLCYAQPVDVLEDAFNRLRPYLS